MKKLFTSFYFIAVLAIGTQAQNVTVAGSGGAANGSYATLKDAFDALNLVTTQAGNNITVSITGNTTEVASAILNQPSVSSWTTLFIVPGGGAARTITGAITGNLIDLNGADNVAIDGLNSGGNSLTISNTATAASNALRFINDASNNIVRNCTIQGSASTASNGVIFFSTGTTTGNDGNNINNCNITAAGINQPVNGVFSQGTSAAIDNSGNTLNANNVSDFFNAALLTTGINIGTGNSTWAITNNKLFQTTTRTYTTANIHNGINVGSGDGNTITGNTIGYAASNATGVYSMAGAVATRFIAIGLAVGTTTATSVQGNIITAISLSTTSGAATTNGILCGINITAGNVNMGNVAPNIIGASSGTDALVAIPTTAQGAIVGINSSSTGTILIQNNIIGSFSSSGTTAAVSGAVFGINVSGATTSMTITGNTIGNATANNMRAGTLGLTTGSSLASAINASTTPVALSVTNNTIQNFSSYGTGTGGYVKGFNGSTTVSTTAAYNVSLNTITNLTTNGALVGYTSGASSAVGIQFSGGLNGSCSQNTISNISNTNAAATTNTVVSGITLASGLNNSASRNKIWGLSNAGTGTTATGPPVVAGIIVRSGTTVANVYNNMISIGDGQTTNTCFLGIMLNHGSTPDPLDNIYFNTVVISGTSAGGALISSCLNRGDLTATARNQVVDIRNNIFINTRTGGTGAHYAISNNPNATSSATGWAANASNYNVLNAAASTIGYWTTAQTFAGWQTASASDANSVSGPAVNLVNIPAGDLHIVFPPSSVIEAAGILIPLVTDDFDGQLRGSFSPTDIGADAGNFVAAGLNMGAEALVTPAVSANGCYTSAETVTIRIRNSDINPINFVTNPVTVTTNVTGAVTQTLNAIVNTGTLGAGLSLDVPMSTTLNMGATGVYTFNAFTAVGGDTNPGNDAMSPVNITKVVLAAGTASASPNQYCINPGAPTLSATGVTGYGGLQWQQSTTPATGFTNIPGATTSPYTLGGPITQTMYYRLQASCNGNTVMSNEVTVTLNNPQITGTTPGASCGPGPVTVTLGATGTGATFSWYDVPTGGVPVGTGTSFTTPPISVNSTYYVSTGSGGGITNLGLPAQLAGTSGLGTTNFGLVFDALAPFTLNSVVVYPIAAAANTPGTVTIDVVSSTGAVLNTATVAVIGNPAASATAQTVTLNFNIAAGTNLKLRPGSRSASITGLLFEPSATAPPGGNYGYPFVIAGVVSINHSTLTAPPANTPRLDLYYYFYNWEVATGCESARTAVLATVTTPPSASISYAGSPYCATTGTASVTQTGTAGGSYSSTAGLSINATTGDINLTTSSPGTYTVTYTIAAAGGCPQFQTTTPFTFGVPPSATISYTGSPYCANTGTATVTQTGTPGGIYSSTAGLSINAATGAINLATSTPGTYTVTYTIPANGSCSLFQTTALFVLNSPPSATIVYSGSPYCTSTGTATVTRTGTAGGVYSSTVGLSINATTGDINLGSSTPGAYTVTYTIAAAGGCPQFQTTTPFMFGVPPTATIVYPGSPYCANSGTATVTRTGTAGGVYSSTAGLSINAATGDINLATSTPGSYIVTYAIAANGSCPPFQTTAPFVLNSPPSATIVYTGSPYCANSGTATVTRTGTAGGVYSSTAGLSINAATGDINLVTSTPGSYTVTYAIAASGSCPPFQTTVPFVLNSPPSATIVYTGSPYCANSGTAAVTRTGTAGGVYSSTAGLSINAASGAVNLATSTAGTYTVTYTIAASGPCPQFQATTLFVLNAPPSATITYSGSPYCNTGTGSVTRTGTAGGVYSSTGGLSIDPSTGAINLAASTQGTYTVTYSIAATGGCPSFSTTTSVTILSLSTAATTAGSNITTSCGATTVNLSITGGSLGAGASWKWYSGTCGGTAVGTGATLNNVPVNTTTAFYVRAEGTCNTTACASVIVTINTQPGISISASPYTSLLPGMLTTLTATVTPPGPGISIAWYKNGVIVPGATAPTLVVSVDDLGSYTATATAGVICTALSNVVNIKDSSSNRLFITPNPNSGLFKVRYYTGYTSFGFRRHLIMYDNKGQKVYDKLFPVTAPYSSMDVNARHLAKGLYVVMVTDYYGEMLATGKVIIQ